LARRFGEECLLPAGNNAVKYYVCGDSGRILARVSDLTYEYWDCRATAWLSSAYVYDHVVRGWAVEIPASVAHEFCSWTPGQSVVVPPNALH
jgi:hypothetical protein